MKELFNTLSNISAFFAEKRFVYEAPSGDKAKPAPAAAEAALAQLAEQAKASAPKPDEVASDAKAKAEKAVDKSRAATDLLNPWPEDENKKAPAAEVKTKVADMNQYRKSLLTDNASGYVVFNSNARYGEYEINFKGNKDDEKKIGLGDLLKPDAKVIYVYNKSNQYNGDVAIREGKNYFSIYGGKRISIFEGDSVRIPQSPREMNELFTRLNSQRLARPKKATKEQIREKLNTVAAQGAFDLAYTGNETTKQAIMDIGNILGLKKVDKGWANPAVWEKIAKTLFENTNVKKLNELAVKEEGNLKTAIEELENAETQAAIVAEKKECQEKGIPFQTYDDALKAKSVVKVAMEDGETKTRPIAGRTYVNEKSKYNYATETPAEKAGRNWVNVNKYVVARQELDLQAKIIITGNIAASNPDFDPTAEASKKTLDDAIAAYKKAQTPSEQPAA